MFDFLFNLWIKYIFRRIINMKYKDWLDEWLNLYVKTSVKDKTYNHYLNIVNLHLKPNLGEYDIAELKPLILQRYIKFPKKRNTGCTRC